MIDRDIGKMNLSAFKYKKNALRIGKANSNAILASVFSRQCLENNELFNNNSTNRYLIPVRI